MHDHQPVRNHACTGRVRACAGSGCGGVAAPPAGAGHYGAVTGLTWTVLMPVKRLAAAKTRLRGAVPAAAHQRLVLALACDTAAAAVTCPVVGRVVVVTSDPTARAALADVGADVLPDVPDAGLNQAIAYAA